MSRREMDMLGWDECDAIIVSGDAYVDHPSFGPAVIARVLIDAGFRTGVIAQPGWGSKEDFMQLGRPRLFFGVTAGNVDSMVSHYSPLGQKRRADAYSPGGRTGLRPNRATIIYCNRLREAYPGVRLVLGGVEASLRRLAHYDYWDDRVRRSILLDAKADILAYGMAERTVIEIARRLASDSRDSLQEIPGTTIVGKAGAMPPESLELPSFEEVSQDKRKFQEAFLAWYAERDQPKGRAVVQRHGDRWVVQHPPSLPLTQEELDRVYDLPYARRAHPRYQAQGKIPAIETVKFSITSHRGCLGSCSFCALAAHQGRIIQWRSQRSIVDEAKRIARMPDFKGHITDVGGPTANTYAAHCVHLDQAEPCRKRECLFPRPCPSLKHDCRIQLRMLEAVRTVPGIRKVSIGTGLRFDLIQGEPGARYLTELCRHYVSGQLRVAPEHSAPSVLRGMRKTPHEDYERFVEQFRETTRILGLKQYLIPYYISGFPGCTLEDMVGLAEFMAGAENSGVTPKLIRQVQDFTPTPMTLASTMYYTGVDPFTGERLSVARDIRDKKLQRAIMQLRDPRNFDYAWHALRKLGSRRLLSRIARLGPGIPKRPE